VVYESALQTDANNATYLNVKQQAHWLLMPQWPISCAM